MPATVSRTDQYKIDLARMIRARAPIIHIETTETERAFEGLVDVIELMHSGDRPRKMLFAWSATKGLYQYCTVNCDSTNPQGTEMITPREPDRATRVIVPYQVGDTATVMAEFDGEIVPLVASGDPVRDFRDALMFMLSNPAYAGLFVFVDSLEYLRQDALLTRLMRDVAVALDRAFQTVILLSTDAQLPESLTPDVLDMPYPYPDDKEMESYIRYYAAGLPKGSPPLTHKDMNLLVRALRGLTAKQAKQALANSLVTYGKLSGEAVAYLMSLKAEMIGRSRALELVTQTVDIQDVGGMELLKEWLQQAGLARTAEAMDFGIKPPRGVLMVGVPGAGKSLTAKMVASIWGVPLVRLDVGALFDGLVGNTEKFTREAIAIIAAIGDCVLWMDEIEKGLGGQGMESDGGTSKRMFATLLTAMEETLQDAGVFMIATANGVDALKPELLRRFSEKFFVDLPTAEARKQIAGIHIRKTGRDSAGYDLDLISQRTVNFTGSEIEQVVQSALWVAFKQEREMTTDDILEAAGRTRCLVDIQPEKINRMRQWAQRARPAAQPEYQAVQLTLPTEKLSRLDVLEL